MDVPELKPGNYTLAIVLDTKSDFGVLRSERMVVVDDPMFDDLSHKYEQCILKKDTAAAAKISDELVANWFKSTVKPGEQCFMPGDKVNCGDPVANEKFSTTLSWYPSDDYLRVRAEVTDVFYTTDAPQYRPWEAASVEIFVCPSGFDRDILQLFIVPEGEGGVPRIVSVGAVDNEKMQSEVIAAWKRTDDGYIIDAKIPWKLMKSYRKGWTRMPVECQVNSKTDQGRVQLYMNTPAEPWAKSRTYAVLTSK